MIDDILAVSKCGIDTVEANKTNQYTLQMNVHLNPYIQKYTEKWIRPLLLDSGCSQIMPNLRQWKFEQIPNPRMEEWPRLAQHQITEDSNEKKRKRNYTNKWED